MGIKGISFILFSLLKLNETRRIIFEDDFDEFKTNLKSDLEDVLKQYAKKSSLKYRMGKLSEIDEVNFNKLDSQVTNLGQEVKSSQEKSVNLEDQIMQLRSLIIENSKELNSVKTELLKQSKQFNSTLNDSLNSIKLADDKLSEKIDAIEERLTEKINDVDFCSNIDGDAVVIGQHARIYPGLTEVSYSFIISKGGAAFLNKFARLHSHTYGFREHKTTNCVMCTGDNKAIASTEEYSHSGYNYMSPSNSDGSFRNCNENINYRPKICGHISQVCEQDWSTMVITHDTLTTKDICTNTSYRTHGIFVKTEYFRRCA